MQVTLMLSFDPEVTYEKTQVIQKKLQASYPNYQWEVKNQVFMHQHSPHTAPYQSARDAVSKYPERCTAIAARLQDGELELLPYGMRIFLILLFSQHFIFE